MTKSKPLTKRKNQRDIVDRRRSYPVVALPDENPLQRKNRLLEISKQVSNCLSSYQPMDEVAKVIKAGLGVSGVFLMMLDRNEDRTYLIGKDHDFPPFFDKLIDTYSIRLSDQPKFKKLLFQTSGLKLADSRKILNSFQGPPEIIKKVFNFLKSGNAFLDLRYLIIPLQAPTGQKIGCIFISRGRGKSFAADEKSILQELSRNISLAVFHRRNEEYLALSKTLQDARVAYIKKINSVDTAGAVYKELLRILVSKYQFENATLWHDTGSSFEMLTERITAKRSWYRVMTRFKKFRKILYAEWSRTAAYNFLYYHDKLICYYKKFSDAFKGLRSRSFVALLKTIDRFLGGRRLVQLKVTKAITAFAFVTTELPEAAAESLVSIIEITTLRLHALESGNKLKAAALMEKSRADFAEKLNAFNDENVILELSMDYFKNFYGVKFPGFSLLKNNRFSLAAALVEKGNKLQKKLKRMFSENIYVTADQSDHTLVKFYNDPSRNWMITKDAMQIFRGVRLLDKLPNFKKVLVDKILNNLLKSMPWIIIYKLPNLGYLHGVLTRNLTEFEYHAMGMVLSAISNRIFLIRNNLELQSLRAQEIRTDSLEHTSWAIGHKLNNLLLQTENAYLMGRDITPMFNEFSQQTRGLMDQTQSREVPAKLININEFARNICDINFYQYKNIKVKYYFCDESPYIFIKNAVLRDMLINLIENARIHGLADRIHIHTAIKKGKPAKVQLEVRDNGKGIPKSVVLKGLGTPGNTTHSKGTGMGLYQITRDLIDAGGTLSYKREKNFSKMILEFPVPEIAQQKELVGNLEPSELKYTKILLIDDEGVNLSIYREVYLSLGFLAGNIFCADSVSKAYKLFKKEQDSIFFILCDLYLKHETGIDLFAKVRELSESVYFCFISGNPEIPEITEAKRTYPNRTCFIQKGVDGLRAFENLALSAVRKLDIPDYGETGSTPKRSEDPYSLFIEGLAHRINNLLIYPISVSEMVLNYGSVDQDLQYQKERIQEFFQTIDLLSELPHFPYMINFILLFFKCDRLMRKDDFQRFDANLLMTLVRQVLSYEDDLVDFPILQRTIKEMRTIKDRVRQRGNLRGKRFIKRPPIAMLLNESTGKVSHVLQKAQSDKKLENRIRQTLTTVYNEVVSYRQKKMVDSKGNLHYTHILTFCQKLAKVMKNL